MPGFQIQDVDAPEKRFRANFGDWLADEILAHTPEMSDAPFWLREQTACRENADIAYLVACDHKEYMESTYGESWIP